MTVDLERNTEEDQGDEDQRACRLAFLLSWKEGADGDADGCQWQYNKSRAVFLNLDN